MSDERGIAENDVIIKAMKVCCVRGGELKGEILVKSEDVEG